jgi:hypothetical protein
MAIQLLGQDGSSVQSIDPLFLASRVSLRPMQCTAWNSIAASTGLLTAVAAGGALFSLRNLSSNLIVVSRVGIGFVCTTAFTAAQRMEFQLQVARAFTASDTGGTTLALTANNGKHRTSLATPSSLDCRIATTAALTAGTKVLDTTALGITGFWVPGVGTSLQVAPDNLFSHSAGDYPLVLGLNEGLNVVSNVLMGAAGVGVAYVNVEFAEATSF